MLVSYLDLKIGVIKKADNSRCGNGNAIRLINLGPIALLSNFKLTTSSGNHLEDNTHAHIVSLMYKLITSARDSDDLSIGFDRSRKRRQEKLTNNNIMNGMYLKNIMAMDVFGFAEHQKKTLTALVIE